MQVAAFLKPESRSFKNIQASTGSRFSFCQGERFGQSSTKLCPSIWDVWKNARPRGGAHSPSPQQAQLNALSQQVAEERQSVVQLHLFVVQSQAKCDGAQSVAAQAKTQNGPQGQTQAHAVIPDEVKVNCDLYTAWWWICEVTVSYITM